MQTRKEMEKVVVHGDEKLVIDMETFSGFITDEIMNDAGRKIIEAAIFLNEGVLEHVQLNCRKSSLAGLGDCKCEDHPLYVSRFLTSDDVEDDQFVIKNKTVEQLAYDDFGIRKRLFEDFAHSSYKLGIDNLRMWCYHDPVAVLSYLNRGSRTINYFTIDKLPTSFSVSPCWILLKSDNEVILHLHKGGTVREEDIPTKKKLVITYNELSPEAQEELFNTLGIEMLEETTLEIYPLAVISFDRDWRGVYKVVRTQFEEEK